MLTSTASKVSGNPTEQSVHKMSASTFESRFYETL